MYVVFSVCVVRHGVVGTRVWEVLVVFHAYVYVCVLCASCGSSQCCIMHDLQFGNAGRRTTEATIWRHTPQPVSLLTCR